MHAFDRATMLLGTDAMQLLQQAHVAVFGIGGVGGYVVEALARSGIGQLSLFDNDTVAMSNINRQVIALHSNVGQYKVDVARQRIADINPQCVVYTHRMFYLPDNADAVDLGQYSFVVDCIDTVAAKLELARRCHRLHIPFLACMGTGNKLDPTLLRLTSLDKTDIDPLARVMRRTLRKEGITDIQVVSSTEPPRKPQLLDAAHPIVTAHSEAELPSHATHTEQRRQQRVPASYTCVPATAGLIAAAEVIRQLTCVQTDR